MEVIVAVIKAFGRRQNEKRISRTGTSTLWWTKWKGDRTIQQNTYNDAAKEASCSAPAAQAVLQLCSARSEALFQLRFSLLRTWFCHAVLCQGIPIILSSPLYVNCVVKIMQAGTERCWLEYFFELRGRLLPDGVFCLTFSRWLSAARTALCYREFTAVK